MSSGNTTADPTEGLAAILACVALSALACTIVFVSDTLAVHTAGLCVSLFATIVGWRYFRYTTGDHIGQ